MPVIPSNSSSEETVVEDLNRIFDVQDQVRILQMRIQEHRLLLIREVIRVVHEVMDEPYRLEDRLVLVHCMVTDSIWGSHLAWVGFRILIDCCFALDVNDPKDNSVHNSKEPEVGLLLVVSCRCFPFSLFPSPCFGLTGELGVCWLVQEEQDSAPSSKYLTSTADEIHPSDCCYYSGFLILISGGEGRCVFGCRVQYRPMRCNRWVYEHI